MTLLCLWPSQLISGEVLRFAIDNSLSDSTPPYRWYNHCENRIDGFNYQLFLHLAGDLNMQLKLVEADFASSSFNMLMKTSALLKEDKADFALGIPALFDGDSTIVFSIERVLDFKTVILLRAGAPDISDLRTLESMKGVDVASKGLTTDKLIKNLKITTFPSQTETALALAEGKGDYWITEKYLAQQLIQALDLKSEIKISELELGDTTGIYIMARKNNENAKILREMDNLIASYRKNGFIARIKHNVLKKWLTDKNCKEPQITQ